MTKKNSKLLNGSTGILGAGVILLSIILLSNTGLNEFYKQAVSVLLQLFLGMLFIVTGIKENATKGKPKGNMFFIVGSAILLTMAYSAYTLIAKLG
jgi:cation transport ATPase